MALKKLNIRNVQGRELPGRCIFDLITGKTLGSKRLALEVTKVQPYQVVRPCHAHQYNEEAAYVISGKGEIWVDGIVADLKEGDAVLLPPDAKHTVKNVGEKELVLVCAFSTPDYQNDYLMFEEINVFSQALNEKRSKQNSC